MPPRTPALRVAFAALLFAPLPPAAARPQEPGSFYGRRFASYEEKFSEAQAGLASPEVRRALTRAELWLSAAQNPEGSWDAGRSSAPGAERRGAPGGGPPLNRVGVTALALLVFLEDGNTTREGPFKQVVARGLAWLTDRQDPQSGLVGDPVGHAFLYGHGIATLALCTAQAAEPEEELGRVAQDAVDCVLRARNPYGAWRYELPPVGDNDTSITGWMVLALKAAEGAGLRTDSEALIGALDWLDAVTDPATGRVGYDSVGSRSSRIHGVNEHFPQRGEGMTAVALLCRRRIGQNETTRPILGRHADLLLRQLPEWDPEGLGSDMYYWYFGTRAMRTLDDRRWEAWKASLHPALLPHQEAQGSWAPLGPWGVVGGRAYSTALMSLCLLADTTEARPGASEPAATETVVTDEPLRGEELAGGATGQRPAGRELRRRNPTLGVHGGLEWLVRHQSPDGHWDADGFMGLDPADDPCTGPGDPLHDVGVTALALLALLGDGNTPDHGAYSRAVGQGIRWLHAQQDASSGRIGPAVGHAFHYDHAIATQALCEAYYHAPSLSRLERTCQDAVDYILRARNPYGAWRYDMPPVGDNDTSVTGWMVLALLTARDAGLAVDDEAFVGAQGWIDEVTDPSSGRVGYDTRGSRSSRITGVNDHYPTDRGGEAMTAAGLLLRHRFGEHPSRSPIMVRQADLMLKTLPEWSSEFANDMIYWYYGTHAMVQMGGNHLRIWSQALERTALDSQRRDGAHRGSWDPVGPWGHSGGRVYSTALMVLALESPSRTPR